ncbi:MAG: histidine kinase dimerization/phospho-acceptor domain-containing protein [candidate division Zixibacteria bacterium]
MDTIIEKADTATIADPPGIYFILESKYSNKNKAIHIDDFEIKTLNHDLPMVSDILHNCSEEVIKAVSETINGRGAAKKLIFESQENTSYYELHCFPQDNSNSPTVGCFLIDRSFQEFEKKRKKYRIHELGLISQAVRAFAETRNLSEILRIILLAVTAGHGLGFNRGFILLSDDSRDCLWGCMATGPSSPKEAGEIWNDLSKNPMTFDEVLRLYKNGGGQDAQINKLITSIKIPLSESAGFIARAAMERRSVIIGPESIENDNDRELCDKFGVEHLALVPLISSDLLQGVILADNVITKRPITDADLNILEIFARYASDAIENSRLYGKLEHQVSLMKEANEKIIRSRENLVRAEKLSSIGKMALKVAHEVRNPLTIIGGYANLGLRKISPDDDSRKILDVISKEVGRIENTLNRFSSVVSMNEKNEDKYSLAEIIRETLGMLSSGSNLTSPELKLAPDVRDSRVFVDKGLFHQALMALLREAARLANGVRNISLNVIRFENSAMIFIDDGQTNSKFAENFYSGLRKRNEDRYQDMAVALEILQHYGGDIGIGSLQGIHGMLYVEIPLWEGK